MMHYNKRETVNEHNKMGNELAAGTMTVSFVTGLNRILS